MKAVIISVDGIELEAQATDTVAVALLRAGKRGIRRMPSGKTRGLFCGIGSCFDCYATIDGVPYERSCQILVYPRMCVETR